MKKSFGLVALSLVLFAVSTSSRAESALGEANGSAANKVACRAGVAVLRDATEKASQAEVAVNSGSDEGALKSNSADAPTKSGNLRGIFIKPSATE